MKRCMTTKDLCALKIENFICVLFRVRHFVRLSLLRSRSRTRPRPHEKQHDLSPLSWQPCGSHGWPVRVRYTCFSWLIFLIPKELLRLLSTIKCELFPLFPSVGKVISAWVANNQLVMDFTHHGVVTSTRNLSSHRQGFFFYDFVI